MGAKYRLTVNSWRDLKGVRHRRGDVVEPPESDIDRLLRARASAPLDDEAAEVGSAGSAERAAAQVEADRVAAEQEASRAAAIQVSSKVPDRPKMTAPDPVWIAYGTARGVAVDGLDKEAIIAAVDELDKK